MVPLFTLATAARADIAAEPPMGMQFLSHSARVEGLAAHPGYVVLAYDRGDPVSAVVAWTPEGEAVQQLAYGGNNRGGGLSAPAVHLMSTAAYAEWRAKATAAVEVQRKACAERGEGCMHISRFVPSLPAPQGAIDCKLAITLETTGSAAGPDALVQVLELTEASATTCVVREKSREYRRRGSIVGPGGCDTAGGTLSVALGLLLVLVPRRARVTRRG
jgi:hypothetical protein